MHRNASHICLINTLHLQSHDWASIVFVLRTICSNIPLSDERDFILIKMWICKWKCGRHSIKRTLCYGPDGVRPRKIPLFIAMPPEKNRRGYYHAKIPLGWKIIAKASK